MLVRKTNPVPIECVARGYLSGSGWKEYAASGAVCGVALPSGLQESDRLPEPIFTPATKATSGHDINISEAEAGTLIGPTLVSRLRFTVTYGLNVITALASPSKMARRIEWATAHHFADLHGVRVPALIVTGEANLDHVVPVEVTRRYLEELRSAEHVVLERTGHNGLVTKPEEFAGVLGRFVDGVRLSA